MVGTPTAGKQVRSYRGCNIAKHSEGFYSTPGGRCRDCTIERGRARYAESKRKEELVSQWLADLYLGAPCMDCDRTFPYCAMDFDHRPGEIKSWPIGRKSSLKATDTRKQRVMEEIRKCDYICACCHRIRTKERQNAYNEL